MQNLNESLKYQQWQKSLEDNQIKIKKVDPLHLVRKPNGDVIFALLNVEATDPKDQSLLPVVMLRGHFVSILTVLIDQETSQKYCLLVAQRRIADGSVLYEHPAGMCDNTTDPIEVAIKELKEEAGLSLQREQIRPLQEGKLFTSPGLLDEGGYLYFCEIKMSREEIQSLDAQDTGAEDEAEYIHTKVVKIDDAMDLMRSATPLLSLHLYQNLLK